jgi:cyclopropane fatty-acyl-phospholipid synthase-like methyltransferase
MPDALFSPAAARNAAPIAEVLKRVLPPSGLVLEIASGSGEHAVHMAQALPALEWQPSDVDEAARRSIVAHARGLGLSNIRSPLAIDATRQPWPVARADAVVAINMIHIAPWDATTGLMAGAGAILVEGGLLYLYGPFREAGAHTAPSNAAFDDSLRARNASWGVREIEAVVAAAEACGLHLVEGVAMPANNLSLIFRKAGRPSAAVGKSSA